MFGGGVATQSSRCVAVRVAAECVRLGKIKRWYGFALPQSARIDLHLQERARQPSNNVRLGTYGRNRTNVWNYPSINNFGRSSEEGNLLSLHPTIKPVALVADAMLDCSARGDLVLDAFLGSGSTLIAAERTGRHCCGLELDPLYVDTIIRRWQAFTGGTARHATSGKSFNELQVAASKHHVG